LIINQQITLNFPERLRRGAGVVVGFVGTALRASARTQGRLTDCSSSGSFAILAAMRRASSRVMRSIPVIVLPGVVMWQQGRVSRWTARRSIAAGRA